METERVLIRCMGYKDTEVKETLLDSSVLLKFERLVKKDQIVLVKRAGTPKIRHRVYSAVS